MSKLPLDLVLPWYLVRIRDLEAAAREVCEDHDLACEDSHGKIDRLREVLKATPKLSQEDTDG